MRRLNSKNTTRFHQDVCGQSLLAFFTEQILRFAFRQADQDAVTNTRECFFNILNQFRISNLKRDAHLGKTASALIGQVNNNRVKRQVNDGTGWLGLRLRLNLFALGLEIKEPTGAASRPQ